MNNHVGWLDVGQLVGRVVCQNVLIRLGRHAPILILSPCFHLPWYLKYQGLGKNGGTLKIPLFLLMTSYLFLRFICL